MARWQRRARVGLGIFAVALVVVLLLVMRERSPQALVTPVERLDPKAVAETRGGDVVQIKGSKQDVRVKFASQSTYEDGRTKLTDFEASIANRGGRSFVVTGKEAWIGSELSSYDVRGGVTLRTSDGLTATSDNATFTEAEGILRSEGPVRFQRERMSGSGVGFTYDKQQDALWLKDRAVIRFAPQGDNPGMEVTAGTAGYSRMQRYLRFERGVRMTREGQVMEATDSTVFLQADRDEPDKIELRGGSKITGASGTGSLQSMQARDINLDYAADGRTLEQAVLAGQSGIQLLQKSGAPGQQLSAEYIDLSLAPDGVVTRLASRDHVVLTLPVSGNAPARTVTATALDGTGEAGRGLTAMTFDGGVEYREAAAAQGGAGRVARAPMLVAALTETGEIENAEFTGGFRFEEGKLAATSTAARYAIGKGVLALTSAKGGAPPHVSDERVAIDAATIDVTLSPRRMLATGTVRTVLSAGRRQAGERGSTLLKDSEAVIVLADKLDFDEQGGKGAYTGKARLTQGQTSIHADAITMDERQGDLSAIGNVVSVLPIAGKKESGAESTSIAKAGEFQFEDAKRRAVYSKHAQMDGVQGNVQADRIELLLEKADNTLDRLIADGSVRVSIDKRSATGSKLTYLPTNEQYQLVGSPVKFIESCRETTGRTLTFYRGSDRISIDGQEQRTETRGGSKCPESPIR